MILTSRFSNLDKTHNILRMLLTFTPLSTGLTRISLNYNIFLVDERPYFLYLTFQWRITANSTFYFKKQNNDLQANTWKKDETLLTKQKSTFFMIVLRTKIQLTVFFFWMSAKFDIWLTLCNLDCQRSCSFVKLNEYKTLSLTRFHQTVLDATTVPNILIR